MPQSNRSEVTVSVAPNGQDFARRALRFRYYDLDDIRISGLAPSGGPLRGGTLVVIKGAHVGVPRGGILCGFGESFVQATSVADDAIRCLSPAYASVDGVPVDTYTAVLLRLTVNNDTFATTSASGTFTYFADEALAITSVYPRSGPARGGTTVTVSGPGFRDLGGVYCKFGELPLVRAGTPSSLSVLSHLQTLGDTPTLTCTAPPHKSEDGAIQAVEAPVHVLLLRVTINNQTFVNDSFTQNFTYYRS